VNERERAKLRDKVARQRLVDEKNGPTVTAAAYYERLNARLDKRRSMLTPRQLEAAVLWGDGYTLREIGDRLGISENAVANRVTGARLKLGVPGGNPSVSRRELLRKIQELQDLEEAA
jgi:DNA-binding CsgD family transcriptional regulator